ncbi:imidazole glycerol phosphate synthase subunit HisF [Pedobacter frigiditerrae]|uniref:Imidazole glycerol phosphate synthase subunit HisF n=1 Tax=Pedobacter frigiditerrae TaxID=2530452 RepID=A0A4R0MXT9_9SPHI|nr:imidazole glycerol phosphate synthase subunit HisF [Pedobacter frigiditerrae]
MYPEADDDFELLRLEEPNMFYGASNLIFENARALRNRVTESESLLWEQLKGKQLGLKFRRQHPISIYIADFYCHEIKLSIELDGGIHNEPEVLANDIERQRNLEELGITVIRFTNNQLHNNLNSVLDKIKQAIQAKQLAPPPSGGLRGLSKRIIPCLDVKDGRTVKGINFVDLRDAGDPVELAAQYAKQGADELVFLDITATHERRKTMIEMVKSVARQLNIPFTIGGGITEIADAEALLNAGADKISINSAAVKNPQLIEDLAKTFGVQFVVLAVDTKHIDGKNIVHLNGGRLITELETEAWIKKAEDLGAGEILLTSMDHDGTKQGFDCNLLSKINKMINIPIIASGGAGKTEHFTEVFQKAGVDAALAASVFHYGEILIPDLKQELKRHNIPVRI